VSKKQKIRSEKNFNKYLYYENSVQTPEEHVKIYGNMFREVRKREPMSLREDFCGTFLISCEWVRSHKKRTAMGMDLDPEPVEYGKKNGFKVLTPTEKKRVNIVLQDVCKPTKEKFDIIGAGNFSFNIFHTRAQMKKYMKAAHASLNKDGIFNLELAGGPGFIQTAKEQKSYRVKEIGGKYTYYWDQQSFDPINSHGIFAIHFKTPKGVMHKNAFVYDWRVWSIPELKDMMLECGFKDVIVYWESSNADGDGTGEYVRTAVGDNAYSWIAFVVGIK
jgi:hypothetical protein